MQVHSPQGELLHSEHTHCCRDLNLSFPHPKANVPAIQLPRQPLSLCGVQVLLDQMKRTLPAGPGSAESHCNSEEFSWDVGNLCSTPYLPDLKPGLETEIPQKVSAVITWAYRLSFPLLFVPKVMTY